VSAPAALAEPRFRSLWLAGLISDAGDWMLLVALPIVVYGLTGSAIGTSAAFLAELAPGVILAPLAGRLADRADRRRVMLTVTLLQAVALLPLLAVHGRSGLAVVYAVIVVQASLSTLFDPAKNALLPTLLESDQLVSGNSLIALNTAIGRLVGGPLGGILLAAGDLRTIVVADALSFLAAAALIARLPARAAQPARADRGARAPRLDRTRACRPRGLPVALRRPAVRRGLTVAFVAEVAQGIFVVLFILFVARRLQGGAGEIGLLRGIQAVGALGAGIALSQVRHGRRPGLLTAAGALVFGVLDLIVWNAPAVTTATWFYVALFMVVGAPGVVMETGLISGLQMASADAERGRVFGALTFVSNAGQAIGMLAAGALTASVGLMGLLNAQGCLYLAAGALAVWLLARPERAALARGERPGVEPEAARRPQSPVAAGVEAETAR
jgi:MFS family permease